MGLPSLGDIFTDSLSQGFSESFREFLGYFVKQFWPGVRTQIDKLPFTRIDFPLLAMPFWLLAVLAFMKFWRSPSKGSAAAAGLAAGLLAYVYFHLWAYWTIVISLLFLYALIFARHDFARLKSFFILVGTYALAVIPFGVNYVSFYRLPDYRDFLYRVWLSEGREFALAALGFDYLFYALLALASYLLYFRRDPLKAVFCWALLAALVVAWNIQLVVGFTPVPDHWAKVASPVLYLLIAIFAYDASRRIELRWPGAKPVIAGALIILAVFVLAKKTVNIVSLSRGLQPWVWDKHRFPKEIADSWEWMNEHLPPEPVVVSSSLMTSQFLPVYTSARPYLARGLLSSLSMDALEERYLTANKLFNVSEDILRVELRDPRKTRPRCMASYCFDQESNFRKTVTNLYVCYFARGSFNVNNTHAGCVVPDEYREVLIQRYRRTMARWDAFAGGFVYYGPWERQFSQVDFKKDKMFSLVYENPLVEIFKVGEGTY